MADHLTNEELIQRMELSENKEQFRRWQAVYLIQTQGLSSAQIGEIVRVKPNTVLQWVYLYNNNGAEILRFRERGGRRRCHMSYDEEISFLKEVEEEAGKGLVITAKTVRRRVEEKLGHEVSADYAYDLLHRHRWKKKSPRPCHPKADKSKQEEYKKKFPDMVEKAAETFGTDDKRPLRVFFEDEGRFGRMSNPVKCRVPPGVRPLIPQQRVREYIYAYTAVSPDDGENFSLILPRSNKEMMNIFLEEFSEQYKDYRVIIAMDGAPWHPPETDNKFDNIRVIRQPPYSPEVNPAEHVWEYIRENDFHNRQFKTLDKLEDNLVGVLYRLGQNKNIVKSVAGFHWANINL